MAPILPMMAESGTACRKLNRIIEGPVSPLRPKSGSGAKTCSSNRAHKLMELAAHAAHQPVPEARHLAQRDCRTRFHFPIGLPERQKNNCRLSHGR